VTHSTSPADRARAAFEAAGIPFRVTTHGPVSSLAEAAAARGVRPSQILKTLVVRRGEGDYLFVLVPGDRQISWPKLRAHLGVTRLSLPDAATALAVTGYERGTITPFGSLTSCPVIADASITAKDAHRDVSIGAGGHGVAAIVTTADLVRCLRADIADVTDPVAGR
jgi:Cys-tRNA(Pro) deacylase